MLKLICSCLLLYAVPFPVWAGDAVGVVMKTSAGDISLEIDTGAAPLTSANFLKYVDGRHYGRNATFYRTVRMDNQSQNRIKIEVIQGGLGGEDTELPYDAIDHETTRATGILHRDGVISMARLEPGTAASEFFICINNQPELDFGGQRNPDGQGFAAFGKVVKGMDVVRAIQGMKTIQPEGAELEYTSGQILIEPVVIYGIERVK
jgi:peptidyl-prolyl cis-trans isomerase A (cyclophilin A)